MRKIFQRLWISTLYMPVLVASVSVAPATTFAADPPPYPIPLAATGQTVSIYPGDDGELKRGVPLPTPRFTDNLDGTITDNLTNLTWLKDAGCISGSWQESFNRIVDLNNGTDFSCLDYQPGSFQDWRMPNINELLSMVNFQFDSGYQPAEGFILRGFSNKNGDGPWSQGDPFYHVWGAHTGTHVRYYFSSTRLANEDYMILGLGDGPMGETIGPGGPQGIWPVRGPGPGC